MESGERGVWRVRRRSVTGWPGRQKCVRVRVGIGGSVWGKRGDSDTEHGVFKFGRKCPVYHLSQVKPD